MTQPNGNAKAAVAVDFNAMIQADREKRKAETLAKEIFGRNRRQSAPAANGGIRKPGAGGSLASRIGPAKPAQRQLVAGRVRGSVAAAYARAAPASSNIDKAWTHDLHSPARSSPARNGIPTGPKSKNRAARLAGAISTASSPNLNAQVNVIKGPANGNNKGVKKTGFNIKGLAGPCIVQAQNFAPGTTTADIESAVLTVGVKVLKITLLATSPMVIAEIALESRDAANVVVDTFNGQTADGRLLKLFIKPGEVTPDDLAPSPPASLPTPSIISTIPSGPRSQRSDNRRADNSSDYTTNHTTATTTTNPRPDLLRARASDNYRPDYSRPDRDRAEVVDGSYGFGGGDERMDIDEGPKGMYSDDMIGSRAPSSRVPSGPFNGGRNGNGRNGGRGRGYGGYR